MTKDERQNFEELFCAQVVFLIQFSKQSFFVKKSGPDFLFNENFVKVERWVCWTFIVILAYSWCLENWNQPISIQQVGETVLS